MLSKAEQRRAERLPRGSLGQVARAPGRFGVFAVRSIMVLAVALGPSACGPDAPQGDAGAKLRPPGPRVERSLEPSELLPADLDLVMRIDIARMQAALGPAFADDLASRALAADDGGEPLLRDAMSRADVVWIGLRLSDLDAGDRVIVVESKRSGMDPVPAGWRPIPTTIEGIAILDRNERAPRSGTSRIVRVGDRAIAFVSPVEVQSVSRVLREGPDERRGDPAAEGIVSLDLRPRRLPTSLERRFPSIGSILGGIERVRASAVLADGGVRLDAQIEGKTRPAAERALRFLEALRDNVEDPRYVALMRALTVEQVEDTVRLRWVLPARVIIALAGGSGEAQ